MLSSWPNDEVGQREAQVGQGEDQRGLGQVEAAEDRHVAAGST